MPHGQTRALDVRAERSEAGSWSWAIFCGEDRTLITRSRPEYLHKDAALRAGISAVIGVRRNLERAQTRPS